MPRKISWSPSRGSKMSSDLSSYERVLSRVNGLRPAPRMEKARKLLGWIACSPSLLTLQEARQALTIEAGDKEGKPHLGGDFVIERLCGPIVEVVDDYIQFVHFTVKE